MSVLSVAQPSHPTRIAALASKYREINACWDARAYQPHDVQRQTDGAWRRHDSWGLERATARGLVEYIAWMRKKLYCELEQDFCELLAELEVVGKDMSLLVDWQGRYDPKLSKRLGRLIGGARRRLLYIYANTDAF